MRYEQLPSPIHRIVYVDKKDERTLIEAGKIIRELCGMCDPLDVRDCDSCPYEALCTGLMVRGYIKEEFECDYKDCKIEVKFE